MHLCCRAKKQTGDILVIQLGLLFDDEVCYNDPFFQDQ